MSGETLDRLNWFRFSPKVDFKIYELFIPIKQKRIFKGNYGIAVFEIKGLKIACLPRMHSFMFILEKNEKGKYDLKGQATKVIKNLMKNYEEYEGDAFDIKNYTSLKKEFVNSLSLIHI